MLKMTTEKWKKLLIWVSAYVNVIVFALIGGYFMLKDDDKKVKKCVKEAFLVFLLFTCIGAFWSLISYFGGIFDGWYSSVVYKIYSILSTMTNMARIIVFAVLALMAVFTDGKEDVAVEIESDDSEGTTEETSTSAADVATEENNSDEAAESAE